MLPGVRSPQGSGSLRFPLPRPQAAVTTEPHVRWPATIYYIVTTSCEVCGEIKTGWGKFRWEWTEDHECLSVQNPVHIAQVGGSAIGAFLRARFAPPLMSSRHRTMEPLGRWHATIYTIFCMGLKCVYFAHLQNYRAKIKVVLYSCCPAVAVNVLSCATSRGAPCYGGMRTCGGLKTVQD